jgi:hypothetical protein
LGAGLTIQPRKKIIVTNPIRGGLGPNWAVDPYDDDEEPVIKMQLRMSSVFRRHVKLFYPETNLCM